MWIRVKKYIYTSANKSIFRSALLTIKYPDLYSISSVCTKIRFEMPNETVEATLRQQDYRVAIEKDIKDWCDTDYKIQEPVRVIGLQVNKINTSLFLENKIILFF